MTNNYLYVPRADGIVGDHVPFDDDDALSRTEAWAIAQRLMASRPPERRRVIAWRRAGAPIPGDIAVVGECEVPLSDDDGEEPS